MKVNWGEWSDTVGYIKVPAICVVYEWREYKASIRAHVDPCKEILEKCGARVEEKES